LFQYLAFVLKVSINTVHLLLTIKVVRPILWPVLTDNPCASTVHGLTPALAAIKIVSPNSHNIKPKIRYNRVILFGFKFRVLKELQESVGIFFKVKIETNNFINNTY
jgi:hypothetical protein